MRVGIQSLISAILYSCVCQDGIELESVSDVVLFVSGWDSKGT